MHAGIDEAGRGPALGPLIVAGVMGDPAALWDMGCRDSKTLTPGRRGHLARRLRTMEGIHIQVRCVPPDVLDAEMARASLNHVGLLRFQEIAVALQQAGARHITVDAADVDAARFGRAVASVLPPTVKVASRHRADADDGCTAAASIVAKVERDRIVAGLARRLERRLGMEMGSGYPSDPKTRAFLRAWHERFGDVPEGTRRRWRPVQELLAPQQVMLDV